MFLTRIHAHVLRPGLHLLDAKEELHIAHRLSEVFNKVDRVVDHRFEKHHLLKTA